MKHLTLLFDGTLNSAATGHYDDITNIFRLNLAISRHDDSNNPQIIFYIPGPGTRGFADEQLGGAFGQGIDQIIREAYVNLASNYNGGDKIYIFGFSRGAIAARALSCLIADSGLLRPQRLHLLPTAWKRFVNKNQGKELHPGLTDLTADVHHDVRIKFIGVFDSVLGRDASQQSSFSDLVFSNNKLSPIVDVATQIISIDDDRKIFSPMLWDDYDPATQKMKQIWMPGVHSDIGGTGFPHFIGIISLLTMIDSIKCNTTIKINEEFLAEFENRLKLVENIRITDERKSSIFAMFTRTNRVIPQVAKQMFVHRVARTLYRRKFEIRGNMEIYRGDYLNDFLSLPPADDGYTELGIAAATRALGMMH